MVITEELGLGNGISQTVGTVAQGSVVLAFVIAFLMIATIIGFIIWYEFSFKHKVRIKEIVNGRKRVVDDFAKEIKDKKGALWWKLKNRGELIPVPPPQAIELTNKGGYAVEVYRTETGDYTYITDKGTLEQLPDEIKKIQDVFERYEAIKKWKQEHQLIEAYEPLTTNQRMALVGQIRKAEEKKKKTWQELVVILAPYVAIIMILGIFMIFFKDAVQPFVQMSDKVIELQKENTNYVREVKEMKQDIQTIKNEVIYQRDKEDANPIVAPN